MAKSPYYRTTRECAFADRSADRSRRSLRPELRDAIRALGSAS